MNTRTPHALVALVVLLALRPPQAGAQAPSDAPPAVSDDLQSARAIYTRELAVRQTNGTPQQVCANVVRLTELYLARLEALRAEAKGRGDADTEAAAARELDETERNAAYQSALFGLAEWKAQAATATRAVPTVTNPAAPVAAARPLPESTEGVSVYAPGTLPPSSSATYRDLALKTTTASDDLTVRARTHASRSTDEQERPLFAGSVRREEQTSAVRLQLCLQRRSSQTAPCIAVVEHFAAPSGGTPRFLLVQRATVPDLDSRLRYIAFPPVEVSQRETTVGRAARGDVSWTGGDELAGTVVSLYAADGTLVWRGATDAALVTQTRGLERGNEPAPPAPGDDNRAMDAELLRARLAWEADPLNPQRVDDLRAARARRFGPPPRRRE